MEFLFSKLQNCELKPSALRVLKTPEVTSPAEFLFTETGGRFLQSSWSKQHLKYPGRPASVVKVNSIMNVLLDSFIEAGKEIVEK